MGRCTIGWSPQVAQSKYPFSTLHNYTVPITVQVEKKKKTHDEIRNYKFLKYVI